MTYLFKRPHYSYSPNGNGITPLAVRKLKITKPIYMQMTSSDSDRIKKILFSFGVKRAGMFGSQARHEADPDSDLDLLIELRDSASLFDVIRLKHTLEDALHIGVDLIEYGAIKPILLSQILSDEIRLI